MSFRTLFYLHKCKLVNEYKNKFFSKSAGLGIFVLVLISILSLSFGWGFGFFLKNAIENPYLLGEKLLYNAKLVFLLVITSILLIKASSDARILRKIELSKLRQYPITDTAIFLFDINVGIFDLTTIYFSMFLIGLIVGLHSYIISLPITLLLVSLIFSLVYLVHIWSEFINSVIKLLYSFPPKYILIFVSLVVALFYSIYNKNIDWKLIVENNPFSWSLSSIFSLIFSKEEKWITKVILLNIFFSFSSELLILLIKMIHANNFLKHPPNILEKRKKSKFRLSFIISLFSSKLRIYLEKDLKYLLRNNRSIGAIIIELLLFIFISYMHVTNVERYQDFYFPVFFITTFPTIVWDFFLNNYWGTEKAGFRLYLFSNAEPESLVLSKNLSFLILRIPQIFFFTIGMSIMFSFKYLPIIALLYFSLTFISLSFSNIVSINNPYPIDLRENPFSHKQQEKFSFIGLLGLLLYLIVPTTMLFIIYKTGLNFLAYLILIVIFSLILFLYSRLIKHSVSKLKKQKEIVSLKLAKS